MKDYAAELTAENTVLKKVSQMEETMWINDRYLDFDTVDGVLQLIVSEADIDDAEKRLKRFAPFIRKRFPETEKSQGIIESPLKEISGMKPHIGELDGRLLLKMDSHLPIAGSVKARGGIYEVLKHVETLAMEEGLLRETDDYTILAADEMRDFFGRYTVQVGSTGNLGLSIGISSAAVGFKVKVHMSADARQWKKDMLRSKGVEVVEYEGDYSAAVAEGRRMSMDDPMSYFVDDENSKELFLGYAVAASRLKVQLDEMNIEINENHPLIVYLPAGVGGAPGGIAYGLKRIFKDNVHCFFAEPSHCPSVLLGFATGRYDKVNVRDFGIDGKTEADGLACPSPSGFVTRIDSNLVSGVYTVEDKKLYEYMKKLYETEGMRIEPSSCAAFRGPAALEYSSEGKEYMKAHGLTKEKMKNAAHICWATGGSLVPEKEWEIYM